MTNEQIPSFKDDEYGLVKCLLNSYVKQVDFNNKITKFKKVFNIELSPENGYLSRSQVKDFRYFDLKPPTTESNKKKVSKKSKKVKKEIGRSLSPEIFTSNAGNISNAGTSLEKLDIVNKRSFVYLNKKNVQRDFLVYSLRDDERSFKVIFFNFYKKGEVYFFTKSRYFDRNDLIVKKLCKEVVKTFELNFSKSRKEKEPEEKRILMEIYEHLQEERVKEWFKNVPELVAEYLFYPKRFNTILKWVTNVWENSGMPGFMSLPVVLGGFTINAMFQTIRIVRPEGEVLNEINLHNSFLRKQAKEMRNFLELYSKVKNNQKLDTRRSEQE